MSGVAAFASQLARGWAAVYTLGVAGHVRESRRAEITSDVWEHHLDVVTGSRSAWVFAASVVSRVARGVPADLLWRVNVEGPKMEIKIPFERIVGALLLVMIAFVFITLATSGYDTRREGFGDELRRLADLSTAADNGNAFFRALSGVALVAVAGGLYANLKGRAPLLSALASFGIAATGVLGLIAAAMQRVFVELAEEYVSTSPSQQEQVLVTARGFAIGVEQTIILASITMALSVYALAILAGRESLVPRWMIAIPVLSAALAAVALVAGMLGMDSSTWVLVMSSLFSSVLWLLVAGLWLLFAPREDTRIAPAAATAT